MSDLKKLIMIGMDSVHEVQIDVKYTDLFHAEVIRILSDKGWRRMNTKIMFVSKKGLQSYNIQDPVLDRIQDILQTKELVYIYTFQKSLYEFLEVKSAIEDGKLLISWNRKISPEIGKRISIITAMLLFISAFIRLLIPIDSSIPMAIFIIGITANLLFLLTIIYLYDKSLERNCDERVSFLESVVFVNDITKFTTGMA